MLRSGYRKARPLLAFAMLAASVAGAFADAREARVQSGSAVRVAEAAGPLKAAFLTDNELQAMERQKACLDIVPTAYGAAPSATATTLSKAASSAAAVMPAAASGSASGVNALFLTPDEIEEIKRSSSCKRLVRQIVDLKKRMANEGLETDFYELSVIPTDELIKDQRGTYYAVYLKDARRKRRFQFPGGRYVIRRFETRFRRALTTFVRDVLKPLHGGVEYALYVRGSASSRPMRRSRRQRRSHRFEEVTYLPKAGDNLYDGNRNASVTFERRYGNDELPYLRAAFLQKIVADFFPLSTPVMLESQVADSRSRSEQYAEILLYVDWQ